MAVRFRAACESQNVIVRTRIPRSDERHAYAPGAASKTSTNDSALEASGADPLGRLTNADALRACLAAIDLVHSGTPTMVDFAKFQDKPALVVVVQQPAQVIAVVVGPDCGRGGANELFSTTIGP